MSDKPGWTAGPYSLYRGEDGEIISVLKHVTGNGGGTTGKSVCRMPIPNLKPVHTNAYLDQAEINATAYLLHAAPALYEALEEALNRMEGENARSEYGFDAEIDQARAALRLARGEGDADV